MPDQEELKLVVTLDDQASAKLASLQGMIDKLNSGGGGSAGGLGGALGKMGESSEKAAKGVKALAGELTGIVAKGTVIGNVITSITEDIGEMAGEVLKDATNLGKLSMEMLTLSTNAYRMGTSAAQLQENMRNFRNVGVPFEEAAKDMQGFSDSMADMGLMVSRVRTQIIQQGLFPSGEQAEQFFRQIDDARGNQQKQQQIALDTAKRIREENTKAYGAEQGARMERQFWAILQVQNMDRLKRAAHEASQEEKDLLAARKVADDKFVENQGKVQTQYDEITESFGHILINIENALQISEQWEKILHVIADVLKYIESIDLTSKLPKSPGETRERLAEPFDKFFGRTTPPAAAPGSGEAAPHHFMSGGIEIGGDWDSTNFMRSGNQFYRDIAAQGRSRTDIDIEDRRDLEDNTEQTKDLTDQLKQLNEALQAPPPGSLAAGLGLGGPILGTGAGASTGGPLGLQSPSGTPYGNDSGPGTGKGAGETPSAMGPPVEGVGGYNFMGSERARAMGFGDVTPYSANAQIRFPTGIEKGKGPQSILANKYAGPDIAGFLKALSDAGAPLNDFAGVYAAKPRQHGYGNAVDIERGFGSGPDNSPALYAWAQKNPEKFREIQKQFHMRNLDTSSGASMHDWGHFEWTPESIAKGSVGPGTGKGAGSTGQTAKTSWFGNAPGWRDPSEPIGSPRSSVPGVALPDKSTMGRMVEVTMPDGRKFVLPQTDVGPAARTGRGIDITAAAAAQMGYTPNTFPTDAPISYRLLDSDGSKLDTSQNVTVNGKGELNVKVSGPPGTSVSGSGEGLLKDTRIEQETQMIEASKAAAGVD